MEKLDPRKRSILRAVILEYIVNAEPVGSEALTQKYDLGVRSATVRNELAEMSDLGYLEQPHTSAGRIPSDLGYRFFVNHLLELQTPSSEVTAPVQEAASEGDVLHEMLRETTRLLSRLTHLLSAATTVNESQLKVRHAVVTALGPESALLVLVLNNGHVENRLLECPPGLGLDDLGRVNERLRETVEGRTLAALRRIKPSSMNAGVPGDKLMTNAMAVLRLASRDLTKGVVITEGEEFMFAQPEFQRDARALLDLIEGITDEDVLTSIHALPDEQGVSIGREHRNERLQAFSVVRRTFYVGDEEAGTLALIGPTRMSYQRSIPLLDFTAEAVSSTLTRLLK